MSGSLGWQIRQLVKKGTAMLLFLLVAASLLGATGQVPPGSETPTPAAAGTSSPLPVLAYYYIWFDPNSWNRAKIDIPALGKYSSNDPAVMRQHIQWAKEAGITGFIVSWKSTDLLNARLEQLVKIADEENFKLVIIYQGLDFNRDPLKADTVANDLDYFTAHFASDRAFDLFGKPLVIWSGTWNFSQADVAKVTQSRRGKLLILASEKNVKGYQRLASLVDGDAYYWSSVNPDTYPDYPGKLQDMSKAIHAEHGLWIAPAAAGFDARLIGGTQVIDRQNGDLLRREFNTAIGSSPDAIGLISWNEFSENSQIEPSQKYGSQYLQVVAEINHLPAPQVGEFDSSEPLHTYSGQFTSNRALALGGFAVLIVASLVALIWRQRARRA